MMQTEPLERPVSKRQDTVARGFAAVLAVVFLVPLAANAALGETTIAHTRIRTHQALVAQNEHAKSSGRSGKAGTSKSAERDSPAKSMGRAAKSAHAASKTVKPEMRARLRSRRDVQPVEEPEPVVMHRAKAGRGHVRQTVRVVERRRAPRPTVSIAANESVPKPTKTLTVDDFMRAASPAADETSTETGKTYVRGESRTEVDDQVSDAPAVIAAKPRILALKPVSKTPAPLVARVEANPPTGAISAAVPITSMTMVTAPEDLTGEPIVPSSAVALPVRRAARIAIAPLPPLSRQEVTEEVEQPVVLPGLYRNGRLVVPAPLKGTHEILVHQNTMADDEGLERVQDDYDLRRMRAAHLLVDYPESASLHINPELAADRRCGRVWSVRFATTIAHDFYARFHQPLQVNSAVRTVAFQVRLQRTNGNAAGIDGDTASPHLTGQAMDLGKRNMSMAQIAWMRSYLLPLMQAGKVDVEEEFQQACFHISVYRSYLPAPAKRRVLRSEEAQLREPHVKSSSHAYELR
jgi:hypothetical protein